MKAHGKGSDDSASLKKLCNRHVDKRHHVLANNYTEKENMKINRFAHEQDDRGMGQMELSKWCLQKCCTDGVL